MFRLGSCLLEPCILSKLYLDSLIGILQIYMTTTEEFVYTLGYTSYIRVDDFEFSFLCTNLITNFVTFVQIILICYIIVFLWNLSLIDLTTN